MLNIVDNIDITQQPLNIRLAMPSDLSALVQLEQECFQIDRLSRRQWRYALAKAHADVIVIECNNRIVGCILVFYNSTTCIARIYSIAVAPHMRRLSIGRQLAEAAEKTVRERGKTSMRLEIRLDNTASIRLFESIGYKCFGYYKNYYADHTDAVRYEKLL